MIDDRAYFSFPFWNPVNKIIRTLIGLSLSSRQEHVVPYSPISHSEYTSSPFISGSKWALAVSLTDFLSVSHGASSYACAPF